MKMNMVRFRRLAHSDEIRQALAPHMDFKICVLSETENQSVQLCKKLLDCNITLPQHLYAFWFVESEERCKENVFECKKVGLEDVSIELDICDPNQEMIIWDVNDTWEGDYMYGRKVVRGFKSKYNMFGVYEDKSKNYELFEKHNLLHVNEVRLEHIEELEKLLEASRDLDKGKGVIWSMCSDHGNLHGTRIVRNEHSARNVWNEFRDNKNMLVRILPLYPGRHLDICGCVFENYVSVWYPYEQVICIDKDENKTRLYYAGFQMYKEHYEKVKKYTKKVGCAMRDEYGFRGVFNMNATITDEGHIYPIEINPRPSMTPPHDFYNQQEIVDVFVRSNCEKMVKLKPEILEEIWEKQIVNDILPLWLFFPRAPLYVGHATTSASADVMRFKLTEDNTFERCSIDEEQSDVIISLVWIQAGVGWVSDKVKIMRCTDYYEALLQALKANCPTFVQNLVPICKY